MISIGLHQAAGILGAGIDGEDILIHGCSTDSRSLCAGNLFVAIEGDRFDGHDFVDAAGQRGAPAALVSKTRNFSIPTLQVDDTIGALAKLAAYWRERISVPLVAITGSNGKTTVKEMLASILGRSNKVLATRGNLNNEIGAPLTLLAADQSHQRIILEIGASHAGEVGRLTRMSRPDVGVITLCAPAHLEGFGSREGVARAKGELLAEMPQSGCAVINADDAFAPLWRDLAGSRRCIRFGMERDAEVTGKWRTQEAGGRVQMRTPVGALDIRIAFSGKHNAANALAAAAAAVACGASLEDIAAGLQAAKPVAGRLETKRAANGAAIIDDTYNANPSSLEAGLAVLADCKSGRWLVLGDMAELGEQAADYHREAGEQARKLGVQRMFTTGELSRLATERFGDGATHYHSQQALIDALRAELPAQTTVLIKGSRSMAMERVVSALTGGH